MRSNDFSAGPPQARATSFFLGCNRYRTPLSMLGQLTQWPPVARALRKHPGYLWHRSYYQFPFGIGLMVGFRDRESLLDFARTPEHRKIMDWLVGGEKTPAKGGFIRLLTAEEWGYTNGCYRADGELGMIENFTPIGEEETGPSTARGA